MREEKLGEQKATFNWDLWGGAVEWLYRTPEDEKVLACTRAMELVFMAVPCTETLVLHLQHALDRMSTRLSQTGIILKSCLGIFLYYFQNADIFK